MWLLPLLLVVAAAATNSATAQTTHGRATFTEGGQGGSCGFGNNIPSGFAGWPDVQAGYQGSCGHCFLVSCEPLDVTDALGETSPRHDACKNPTKEVLVQVTDTCTCNSNRRWCCGDAPHLVVSRTAFSQLADAGKGVISIKWRPAACDYQQKPSTTAAPPPSNSSASSLPLQSPPAAPPSPATKPPAAPTTRSIPPPPNQAPRQSAGAPAADTSAGMGGGSSDSSQYPAGKQSMSLPVTDDRSWTPPADNSSNKTPAKGSPPTSGDSSAQPTKQITKIEYDDSP